MHPPRSLLASRYELTAPLKSTRHVNGWVGIDVATGAPIRVCVVDAVELSRYERIAGVRQLHLTGVIETIVEAANEQLPAGFTLGGEAGLIVLEYVGGISLHRFLQGAPPVAPFKAIAWLVRLIGAIDVLHDRSVAHGAVNPRSVLVNPLGRFIPPVLTLASAPVLAGYCSPERIRGAEPNSADDVWALIATLYRMVTGVGPFKDRDPRALLAEAARGRPKPIHEFGVDDPELQRLFDVGFEPNERHRLTKTEDLKRALDRWEREESPVVIPRAPTSRAVPRLGVLTLGALSAPSSRLVYDDERLPVTEGEAPDVVRRSVERHVDAPSNGFPSREPNTSRVSEPSSPRQSSLSAGGEQRSRMDSGISLAAASRLRARRKPWLVFAVPLVVGALGVGYMEFGDQLGFGDDVSAIDARVEGRARAIVSEPRTVPKKGVPLSRAERLSQCVKSYFPANVFSADADFGFVCEGGDFRDTTLRLFGMSLADADAGGAVAAASGGDIPPVAFADAGILVVKSSMDVNAQQLALGWYELAAAAITREGCCQSPPSIELPETKGWCLQLKKAVRQIAADSRKPGDLSPTIRTFDEAVECLFANQIPRPYQYALRPSSTERGMLQRFLTRVAESDAMRSTHR